MEIRGLNLPNRTNFINPLGFYFQNGDTALHISSAMGRKKLTKILLSAGCLPNVQNKQNESPLDISLRKGFEDVSQVLRNPPRVVTPMERDQMRSSKYKSTSSTSALQTAPAVAGSSKFHHGSHPVLVSSSHTVEVENHRQYSKRSNPSSTKTGSQSKSMSSINRGTGTGSGAGTKTTVSSRTAVTEVPKWSPYGCHNQPNPGAFPPPNIDSLPSDPLTTGELYYLDLAGNIKKVMLIRTALSVVVYGQVNFKPGWVQSHSEFLLMTTICG